jgi:hypothetical protein
MSKHSVIEENLGTVTALMRRASRRLPRLLRIKKAVDNGKRLNNFQSIFLSRVFRDARDVRPYYDKHQELQETGTKMVNLYHEITERALKNEQALLQKKCHE